VNALTKNPAASVASAAAILTRDNPGSLLTRRATVNASSWNSAERTLEVVFSTGAGVPRVDTRGAFTETLSLTGFTAAEGIPFLDHHRNDSFDAILGSVISTNVVGNEARAFIRLSKSNPVAIRLAEELDDGQRFGISVGYEVDEWQERTEGGQRIKEAVKWRVREISLVSIPADASAGTRSHESQGGQTGGERAGESQNRAEIHREIRAFGRALGLGQDWIDRQIDAGRSSEAARQDAMNTLVQRGSDGNLPNTRIEFGADYNSPEHLRRTFGEAIYARVNGQHRPSEAARPYVNYTLGEIGEEMARRRGISREGRSRTQFLIRLMSTSDFANILEDASNRVMLDAHRMHGSALKRLGRQVRAPDFRPLHFLQLSEGQILEKVGEHGEVKSGKFIDAKESFSVEKRALRFGLTDRVIVNDDIGLVDQMGRRFGEIAAATEGDIIAGLVTANSGGGPKMSDGKNLFHADHGNLAASGNTPWLTGSPGMVAELSKARLAMRRQKGLQGQPVSVTPKYVIVPPEGETETEKALTEIAATKVDDVNPFPSRLQSIVEPRLTDVKAWYIAADPMEAAALEWAYLEGQEGPVIESRAGWEIEGVEFKLKITFGAGFVDHRGWYRNPGDA